MLNPASAGVSVIVAFIPCYWRHIAGEISNSNGNA
jgi:hypothetical protein